MYMCIYIHTRPRPSPTPNVRPPSRPQASPYYPPRPDGPNGNGAPYNTSPPQHGGRRSESNSPITLT